MHGKAAESMELVESAATVESTAVPATVHAAVPATVHAAVGKAHVRTAGRRGNQKGQN